MEDTVRPSGDDSNDEAPSPAPREDSLTVPPWDVKLRRILFFYLFGAINALHAAFLVDLTISMPFPHEVSTVLVTVVVPVVFVVLGLLRDAVKARRGLP